MIIRLVLSLVVVSACIAGCSEDNDPVTPTVPESHSGDPDLVITEVSLNLAAKQYTCTFTNIGNGPANLDGPTDEEYDNVSIQGFYSQDTEYVRSAATRASEVVGGFF